MIKNEKIKEPLTEDSSVEEFLKWIEFGARILPYTSNNHDRMSIAYRVCKKGLVTWYYHKAGGDGWFIREAPKTLELEVCCRIKDVFRGGPLSPVGIFEVERITVAEAEVLYPEWIATLKSRGWTITQKARDGFWLTAKKILN